MPDFKCPKCPVILSNDPMHDSDHLKDLDEAEQWVALANLKRLTTEQSREVGEEMWHIVRALAVLDWAMRKDPKSFPMDKFETIMRKVRTVAEAVISTQKATVN